MKKAILLTAVALITLAVSKNCSAQWSLTGNAGTTGTNFLGTTDNVALKFKTKNLNRMIITGGGNVGIGTTAPGYKLQVIGTGRFEDGVKIGGFGVINMDAPGIVAGRFKIDSAGNVGIGISNPVYKLEVNGDANINGVKVGTGLGNGTNLIFGSDALSSNTLGVYNIALGNSALYTNTTGTHNTALGLTALNSNTSGYQNIAVGNSLSNNEDGSLNVGIGFDALYSNVNGSYNTAAGHSSLSNNVSGTGNVAYGYLSLQTVSSGINNTGIGTYADASSGSLENSTAVGYQAIANASNKVRIGNSSVSSYSCQVNWTAGSDARIKDNVQENIHGLDFINALRPVTFHYNIDKQNALMGVINDASWKGKRDIENIAFSGFIAQEVDAAAQKAGYDFSGVDKSGTIMGLRYSEFTVPLVKGMQELSAENKISKEQIQKLKDENEKLKQTVSEMKSCVESLCDNSTLKAGTSSNATESSKLFQNQPNPFSQSTVIRYALSAEHYSGAIVIRDLSGNTVKSIAINNFGKGQVTVNANELAQGTYTYTLEIADESMDTKLMVITK